MPLTRTEITARLTKASIEHFVKLRFGVYKELGLTKGGTLRGDLVCINYRKKIIVVEVKSSYSDWNADSKWPIYLGFADQLIFVVPQALWDSGKMPIPGRGAGVMVLSEATGHLKSVVKASMLDLDDDTRESLILRMAFRGDYTKRNVKRRTRIYLGDN